MRFPLRRIAIQNNRTGKNRKLRQPIRNKVNPVMRTGLNSGIGQRSKTGNQVQITRFEHGDPVRVLDLEPAALQTVNTKKDIAAEGVQLGPVQGFFADSRRNEFKIHRRHQRCRIDLPLRNTVFAVFHNRSLSWNIVCSGSEINRGKVKNQEKYD